MKIFYIHHALRNMGNPPSNDDGILPLGIKDAKLVAKILRPLETKSKIKAIYTSPYFRCKKTAEIINKYFNVPVIEEPRLNEYNNVFAAVKGQKGNQKSETWAECQQRIQDAIKDIVYKYDDRDAVLCITSGVNLTAFINIAYHLPPSNTAPFPLVAGCSPVGFDISIKDFEGK